MDYRERHFLDGMNEGELQLYNKCLWLEDDDFRLIPNALFQRADEGTNQIDLLAVTKKGIFVMEMKDYKGWIFGDENHKQWTQVLQSGFGKSRKYQLRNPVKQNDNHIKTVRSLLAEKGINNLPIYNVIVFGNEAVLKEISTSVDVVNLSKVTSVFGKYRDLVITNEEIKAVYELLEAENIKDAQARESHLAYVSSLKGGNAASSQNSHQKERTTTDFEATIQRDKKAPTRDSYEEELNQESRRIRKDVRVAIRMVVLLLLFIMALLISEQYLLIILLGGFGLFAYRMVSKKALIIAGGVILALLVVMPLIGPFNRNQPEVPAQQMVIQPAGTMTAGEMGDDARLKEQLEKLENEARELQAMESVEIIIDIEPEKLPVDLQQSNTPIEAVPQTPNTAMTGHPDFIDIGMRQDQVQRLVGEPEKIELSGINTNWVYGLAWVSFDDNGRVAGWNNDRGRLDAGMR
ncbi:MAG: nuclease-related domain-containing protein, partial [Bacillota bacterium]|nr:nuclease-related domain-containing protein [Bacillota bacterium]